MIYFIQNQTSKAVKIGYTAGEAIHRLRQLQTACQDRLELIGEMEGTQEDEKFLHRRFIDIRLAGEWFAPTTELLAWIGWLAKRVVHAVARPTVRIEPQGNPYRFLVGLPVIHPMYGKGKVVSLEGDGPGQKGTVYFDDKARTFILSKCPLRPAIKTELFEHFEKQWETGNA